MQRRQGHPRRAAPLRKPPPQIQPVTRPQHPHVRALNGGQVDLGGPDPADYEYLHPPEMVPYNLPYDARATTTGASTGTVSYTYSHGLSHGAVLGALVVGSAMALVGGYHLIHTPAPSTGTTSGSAQQDDTSGSQANDNSGTGDACDDDGNDGDNNGGDNNDGDNTPPATPSEPVIALPDLDVDIASPNIQFPTF